MSHFSKFAKAINSQNGEDGIIAEVIRQLGIESPGTFVEFGTGNGRDMSNTLALAEKGWSGVWIEQNRASYETMKALAGTFNGRVEGIFGTVGFGENDSLDLFLLDTQLPHRFDFLSIDIDSYDLQVWEALHNHRAKIVLIEINSGIPLSTSQVHGDGKQGASFTAMLELGTQKGYRLVAHTGNMLFVDLALADKLDLPQSEIDNPNVIFNDMWVRWAK